MFTGLVEAMGEVVRVESVAGGVRHFSLTAPFAEQLELGESVAVDGVCLTVVRLEDQLFEADVIPESLQRTTLGELEAGHVVNLERAMQLGDRLGGHLVQGHVDATCELLAVAAGEESRLTLALPEPLRGHVAFKGSVTLNGVSLTVAAVRDDSFEVALIPETLKRTNLGRLKGGERVNLEADLLSRYLERLLEARGLLPPIDSGERGNDD
jgi:riboflavin synthase